MRGGFASRQLVIGGVLVLIVGVGLAAAQERIEHIAVLEQLRFLPEANEFEVTVRGGEGVRTLRVHNRAVRLGLDAKLLRDPQVRAVTLEGPVVFYTEEREYRVKTPFLSRVTIIFLDVPQLQRYLGGQ
ncbi:MAG: hypothetical protein ACE5HK_04485 [Candidatus Methylomirabilales bacterium]